jgi:hypothetical protein
MRGVIPGRAMNVWSIGRVVLLSLVAALVLGVKAETAALSPLVPDLPVTNGLIRWWPNLFDVRDEITGEEGVVMGLLPAVETGAMDETEFGWETGWAQLRPAITNEVFTLMFWVYGRLDPRMGAATLIAQESASAAWFFHFEGPLPSELQYIICGQVINESDREEKVRFTHGAWHHLAVMPKVRRIERGLGGRFAPGRKTRNISLGGGRGLADGWGALERAWVVPR